MWALLCPATVFSHSNHHFLLMINTQTFTNIQKQSLKWVPRLFLKSFNDWLLMLSSNSLTVSIFFQVYIQHLCCIYSTMASEQCSPSVHSPLLPFSPLPSCRWRAPQEKCHCHSSVYSLYFSHFLPHTFLPSKPISFCSFSVPQSRGVKSAQCFCYSSHGHC